MKHRTHILKIGVCALALCVMVGCSQSRSSGSSQFPRTNFEPTQEETSQEETSQEETSQEPTQHYSAATAQDIAALQKVDGMVGFGGIRDVKQRPQSQASRSSYSIDGVEYSFKYFQETDIQYFPGKDASNYYITTYFNYNLDYPGYNHRSEYRLSSGESASIKFLEMLEFKDGFYQLTVKDASNSVIYKSITDADKQSSTWEEKGDSFSVFGNITVDNSQQALVLSMDLTYSNGQAILSYTNATEEYDEIENRTYRNYPIRLSIIEGTDTLVYTGSLKFEGPSNENHLTKSSTFLANAEGKKVAYLEIDPKSRRLNIQTYNSDGELKDL